MISFRRLLCLASVFVLFCEYGDLPTLCSGEGGEQEKRAKEPDAATIAILIDQLGSPKFTERQKATKALEAIGLPALYALRKASTSPIPEVSRRATRLAEIIENSLDQFLADEKQFAVVYPKFQKGEWSPSLLEAEIDMRLPPALPSSDERREKLAKRQANAAVALLRMNRPEKVWPLLKHSPDPRVRSYLIHRFGPLRADAGAIIKHLDEEGDITIRRALILSLGEFGEKELPPAARNSLLPKLQAMYRTDADPGLHAAVEWLLRTWKQQVWLKQTNDAWAKEQEQRAKRIESIQQLVNKDREKAPPQWYVNGQGQTMVVIPGPVTFMMGSPVTEAGRSGTELQHQKRIGRTFAIAATSVTKEQLLRFLPKLSHHELRRYPEPTCPIGGVVWYEAAAYCNWLSERDGIAKDQWCYETDRQGVVTKLKEKYLSLAGYRLPTEAEWEYACRAGTVTSRYYGETEELLPKYGWYFRNSQERSWPVGSMKPNDLGLFDMHGNIWNWCQESHKDYSAQKSDLEDKEDNASIVPATSRAIRGGSFSFNPANYERSAHRIWYWPSYRYALIGFRLARTIAPLPPNR